MEEEESDEDDDKLHRTHWMETDLIDSRTLLFEDNLAFLVIGCDVTETSSS